MRFFVKLFKSLKNSFRSIPLIYPIIIIIAIPLLLVINTVLGLRNFNRDVNFLIRHQALSIAETLKPVINENSQDPEKLNSILDQVIVSNSDIKSATLLRTDGNNITVLATTDEQSGNDAVDLSLNHFAIGLNQSFAGLMNDPETGKNLWNVVIPISDDPDPYLFSMQMKTDLVESILARTARDSYIILAILIVITLILIANHFVFYIRSLEAKKLAEIDKLKDEFISMAAHELRSPITGLTGYLEMLRQKAEPMNIQQIAPDLDTLDLLTKDLHNLIEDLLNVSRIEQGRLSFDSEETDVNEVINKVITSQKILAEQKGLEIIYEQKELPKINTDPEKLKQVINNLASNAVKYTIRGKITITTQKIDNNIKIMVKDTGIGIPPEKMGELFGKFNRIKDEKTQEVRGTGLGLYITKKIVEEYIKGKIYAESIYGTGTSFTVIIPLGRGKDAA